MTLRILTVLGGGQIGGAEAFFVSLTAALKRAGLDVHAVLRPSSNHEADLRAAGVSYRLARFGGPWDVFTTLKLKAITRAFKPDIVLGFASRANARMPRGPYVHIGRLGGYYNLKYFKACNHLVCNAPDVVRHVVENGWPRDRVTLIPNFPNLMGGTPIARASLDTPDGVPLALALGRLHRNKAFDTLLKAMPQLPGVWLWIAGEGPERPALEKLARDLGLTDRVRFLGWRTDRGALFRTADICAYPSRVEPFGNVVVEAWGHGVPLVTAASAGPAWLTHDGEDAVVVPIDDAKALGDGMRAVLSSPGLAGKLAANGKRRVAEEFSEPAIVKRYIQLFEELRR